MAVQWDKEKGSSYGWGVDFWNAIRGIKKDLPEVNEEIKKFIETNSKFFEGVNAQNAETLRSVIVQDAEELSNVTDELRDDFASFLETADLSGDILKQYQAHLKKTGKEVTDFSSFTQKASTALKSLGAAMASMAVNWAIGEIIGIVVKAVDNLAHSAEHCKERVDELMSSYKSALDKANSNANKSY